MRTSLAADASPDLSPGLMTDADSPGAAFLAWIIAFGYAGGPAIRPVAGGSTGPRVSFLGRRDGFPSLLMAETSKLITTFVPFRLTG